MPDCCVCMHEMDMEEFDDPNESTHTCVRLDCKHAYHTKCVLKYMKETNFDCIMCNTKRNPIEIDGLVHQALVEVRKDKKYREIKRDLKAAAVAFRESKKVMTAAVNEFINQHKDEWKTHEKRREVLSLDAKLTRYVRSLVLAKPMLAGAIIPKLNGYYNNNGIGIPCMWMYRRTYFFFKY